MNAAPLPLSIVNLAHGMHRNVPGDVYHARIRGLVSKSVLDLVHRSPAHYAAWLAGHDEEETAALAFGSAFHCALLEPARFSTAYAVEADFGDCRVKVNKAKRDAWRARYANAKLLSEDDDAAIRGMVSSVRAHPLAARMMREGEAELTIRWRDEETGLECKSRADWYVPRLRMVVDVKTSSDASAESFRRDIAKYRYHVQDALYRAAFGAIREPVAHFVFLVVEKTEPFAVATYTLDASGIEKGFEHACSDMARLAECVRTNEFPGYPVGIQTLNLPPWAA